MRKRSSTEADREQDTQFSFFDEKENSSQEETVGSRHVYTRQEKRRSGGSLMSFVPPQSPMKRPEPMALDEAEVSTPSAKRRSLHGPSSMSDFFKVFDEDTLSSTVTDNRSQDDNDWSRTASPTYVNKFRTFPKRSSSLRKSTIQQRPNERSSNIKFSQPTDLTSSLFDIGMHPHTERPNRMSLDNFMEPLPRDSPFSAHGNLLNASVHPATVQHQSQISMVPSMSRHPLARTMTQSSSTSSPQDESPTHEPFHRPFRRSHDFSKSLPPGAMRPTPSEESSQQSAQSSFATPGAFKSVKPLPAAFMSTGLISKKNRNIDDPNGGLPKAHMPDTPCKKQSVMLNNDSKFGGVKPSNRMSIGTPGTPAEPPVKPLSFVARSLQMYGNRQSRPGLTRKISFASIDTEGKTSSQSPIQRNDTQTTDSDYPPTPSKHFDDPSRGSVSPSPRHARNLSLPLSAGLQFPSSKLNPMSQSPESPDEDNDSVMAESPSAVQKPRSRLPVPVPRGTSFTRGRLLKNLSFPTPLARSALVLSTQISPVLKRTKSGCVPPVTPHGDKKDRFSPHTPQESVFPVDPSGLTISGRKERPSTRNGLTPAIPATPTGPREYFPNFSNRPSLDLSNAHTTSVDSSLSARFNKVDLIGTGEFSTVYRVSEPPQSSPYHQVYVNNRPSSRNSIKESVWAVKKSRHPYTGPKDRLRKLNEVEILKVLGRAEHNVGFVDSWENDQHLYIQTEFCEEGTLDAFLGEMGAKARLDDFRIWKIMLELSQGLKHIHGCGFIHLDLKPANILISWEGILKIADFGMATKWPAPAGIEGEGDREYIGPEILQGKYDKPADIFALGLIMLETAGNVELPDNGETWLKLRRGDLSDVPSLTFSSDNSIVTRDASGNPIAIEEQPQLIDHVMEVGDSDESNDKRKSLTLSRVGELLEPPQFMIDATYSQSLDAIVRWMISPNPADRPTAVDILDTEGIRFTRHRRRAGATVYEGSWGPADEVLAEDAEMLDV